MTTTPVVKKYQPDNCPRHVPVPQGAEDAEGRWNWECMLCGHIWWATRESVEKEYGVRPKR